jgi:hypothetical protein
VIAECDLGVDPVEDRLHAGRRWDAAQRSRSLPPGPLGSPMALNSHARA